MINIMDFILIGCYFFGLLTLAMVMFAFWVVIIGSLVFGIYKLVKFLKKKFHKEN